MSSAATCLQCPPLLEANAGQVQLDVRPFASFLQRDLVGLCVRSAYVAAGPGVFDDDVLDRVTSHVVVTAEVSARAEEPTQSAVIVAWRVLQ